MLRLPTRCAILALLSNKKVSLFNDSLTKLMKYFIGGKWNRKEPNNWDELDEMSKSPSCDQNEARFIEERRSTRKAAFIVD